MSCPGDRPIRVLFICMGNICRSPLAEGVFRHGAERRGVADRFFIDSAGTGGWHVGARPDRRAREIAAVHGLELSGRARQVCDDDFDGFDHLLCMDDANYRALIEMGAPPDRLRLLLEVDGSNPVREVPDPYYGGADGFGAVYDLIESACAVLLDDLLNHHP